MPKRKSTERKREEGESREEWGKGGGGAMKAERDKED